MQTALAEKPLLISLHLIDYRGAVLPAKRLQREETLPVPAQPHGNNTHTLQRRTQRGQILNGSI